MDIDGVAAVAGVELGPAQRESLLTAAERVAVFARASGISQYDSPQDALERALVPGIFYFALADSPRSGTLVDLGAGSGALGAAIAIIEPNLEVTLADRAERSYTACELLVRRLRLPNLTARRFDAGAPGDDRWDVVVFRALARGEQALELARSVVRSGGYIAAFHKEGDPAYSDVSAMGLRTLDTVRTNVPGLVITGYSA